MRKYKCPYCNERSTKKGLINHVENKHEELIPEGYTAGRVVFNSINKKDHGICVVCKKDAPWNEERYKYDRTCGSKQCKQALRDKFKKNMLRVHGKTTLLDDPSHQEKMLANRSISGTYTYSDGTKFTYTGTYEKNAIEFMDKILHLNSEDITMPGPVIDYIDEFGKSRKWITDIFYIPYNLIIEVKDGGNNPNTRPMKTYRHKQISKEKSLIKLGKYNYLRLTNNNFAQLLEIFADLKMEMIDEKELTKPIFRINEFMAQPGGIPPQGANDMTIVQYGYNNAFSGDTEGFGLSDHPTSKNMKVKNKDNKDEVVDTEDYLGDKKFSLYRYKGIPKEYTEAMSYYEYVCGKKLLSIDQLDYDDDFVKVNLYPKDRAFLADELVTIENMITKGIDYIPLLSLDELTQAEIKLKSLPEGSVIMTDPNGYFAIWNDYRTRSYKTIYEIDGEYLNLQDRLADEAEDDGFISLVKNPDTEKELDDQLDKYKNLKIDFSRRSDEESRRIYGKDVEVRYNELKTKFLNTPMEYDPMQIMESIEESYSFETAATKFGINIVGKETQIKELREWSLNSGIYIILPTKTEQDLTALWTHYLNMPIMLRWMSDWKLLEVFGCTNETMHDFLVHIFNNTTPLKRKHLPLIESVIIDDNDPTTDKLDGFFLGDLPFYTPEEIERFIDDGTFNDTIVHCEIKPSRWLIEYKKILNGKKFDPTIVRQWLDTIRECTAKLKDDKDNKALMETILQLGWNPYLEFTPVNRSRAKKRVLTIYNDRKISSLLRESRSPLLDEPSYKYLYDIDYKDIDYNKEFIKTHFLMIRYEREKSIDGIKFECAKLWFLNLTSRYLMFTSKNSKDQAMYMQYNFRAINTFNKYIEYIKNEDKNFNFANYYARSPFSDNTIRIRNSDLNYTVQEMRKLGFI